MAKPAFPLCSEGFASDICSSPCFRRPAALQGAPPGAAGAHAGWLARQYAAMAELLSGRIDPAAATTDQVGHLGNVKMCW